MTFCNHHKHFISNLELRTSPFNEQDTLDRLIFKLVAFKNFFKYADTKVKHLGALKKMKAFGCKYINETPDNIKVLDCTWFTDLVRSEGFKVRGHFRLQPCGKGMKDKKLIWINDFEKHGYTKKHKKPD